MRKQDRMLERSRKLLPDERAREWASRITKQRLANNPVTAAPRGDAMFMSSGCFRTGPTSKE